MASRRIRCVRTSSARLARGFRGDMLLLILSMTSALASASKVHDHLHDGSNHVSDGSKSQVQRLEVVCSRDHMTVHMHFDQPFYGVVFSHGTPRHERCVHVGPGAGVTSVSFDIRYDGCGTVEDLGGRFHENTIVIQMDEAILEAWDEAKRLRCEWLESFEKQSSKPTLAISDLDVVELNFQGDDIDCWMEVQEGKGPWARQVGGLVPIGSPLTLVIAINDHSREFDMRIKRCSASDGKGSEIELTDHDGCITRPSLLTPFAKVRDFGAKATLVAYSHLFAFKFPDKMDVFVHCIVEVCRHGCTDSCTRPSYHPHHHGSPHGLESKKVQKLAEFSKSTHHHHYVSGQLPKSTSGDVYPGREKNRDELIPAAQKWIQHVSSKNSSTLSGGGVLLDQRPTFKPLRRKSEVEKSPVASASASIHSVFENGLVEEHRSKLTLHQTQVGQQQSSPTVHRIIGHDVHWVEDNLGNHNVPPSSPKDVSHHQSAEPREPQATPRPLPDLGVNPYHLNTPYVTKMQWSSDDIKPSPLPSKSAALAEVIPQPEPAATWTFEEVKPMHSPEAVRLQQSHAKPPPEPQPEPSSSWSFDEVRGLSKENLRVHSLNHKMKSSQHHQPPLAPVYKEFVHPYSTSTVPQPVYVSRYPQNPSNKGMMKMMMMMPTMLPVTYQTAHWPHRTTSRYLKPQRHHYPYPIPQFSSQQQMMMSVIGDRRMDEDSEDVSLNHRVDNQEGVKGALRRIQIGETAKPVSESNVSLGNSSSASPLGDGAGILEQVARGFPSLYFPDGLQQMLGSSSLAVPLVGSEVDNVDGEVKEMSSAEQQQVAVGDHNASRPSASESKIDSDTASEGRINSAAAPESKIDSVAALESNIDSATAPESKLDLDTASESKIGLATAPESKIHLATASESKIGLATTVLENSSSPTEQNIKSLVGSSAVRPAISGFIPPSLDSGAGSDPERAKDRSVVPGPRSLDRRKRSSEPVFGVRQMFRAIAPSDLAFEWNLTGSDVGPTVYRGRREEIVYGVCISPAGMGAGVGFILTLTLLSIVASVVLYEHSCRLSNKTSQLAFLTRNFNGQFEALYRITRPYLYSDNRCVS